MHGMALHGNLHDKDALQYFTSAMSQHESDASQGGIANS